MALLRRPADDSPGAGDGPQVEVVLAGVVLLAAATAPTLVAGFPLASVAATVAAVAAAAALLLRLRDDNAWSGDGWRQLERLIPELVGQADEPAILRLALADSPELLRCDRVEVVLERHGVPDLVASRTRGSDAVVDVRRGPFAAAPGPSPGRRDVVVDVGGSSARIGRLVAVGGPLLGRRTRRHLAGALAHVIASAISAERLFAGARGSATDPTGLAYRDELTGLGNRSLLTHRAARHLGFAVARQRVSALLMLDLDDFKRINDTFGHAAGDRVLAEVGRRLRREVRDSDLAVRLGGDEFAVLAGDLGSAEDAAAVAERLIAALGAPLRLDDVELTLRASVGFAVHGEDADSLDSLLQAADLAMYQAKHDGLGRWRRYSASASGTAVRGPALAQDLRGGIPDEQLVLHYQPQVDTHSGLVVGFEALARWRHPEHGMLLPEHFVPEAERLGLTRTMTRAVLARALRDLGDLRAAAPAATMSLDISARHLLSRGFLVDLQHALASYGWSARDLTLEIDEPGGGAAPTVRAILDAIGELGCDVSVHGFGPARSSLAAISDHPAIREIKIDPGVASATLDDPSAERLVRGVVTAAHGLGLRVVAEGVESEPLTTALGALGCDRLQGGVIHEPAPVDVLTQWLREAAGPVLPVAISGVRPAAGPSVPGPGGR